MNYEAMYAMEQAIVELFEVQAEKFEFDNEVVFQYNYINSDAEVKEMRNEKFA